MNMGSEEGVKYDSWYSTCTTLQMLAIYQEGFGGEARWGQKCRAQFGQVKLEMTVRCPKMKRRRGEVGTGDRHLGTSEEENLRREYRVRKIESLGLTPEECQDL